MKCPQCNDTSLSKTNREGFEIGYCQNCKGIWLERGELDKIILRLQNGDVHFHESDFSQQEKKQKEINTPEDETHNSPIMESIRNSKELYQLHKNEGKHHWMHRLFH
jgi:Zn-finger nucleic acid-binding protein